MSVGSNPTPEVELSEAAKSAEVGDGGQGVVLWAVGVGERKLGKMFYCIKWRNFQKFYYPKTG